MHKYFGRFESSFLNQPMVAQSELFAWVLKEVDFSLGYSGDALPFEADDFILVFEVDKQGKPTGEELTLFVDSVDENTVSFMLVDNSPDEFWKQWTEEENFWK